MRLFLAMTTCVVAMGICTTMASAASAGPSAGPLCEGFSACSVAPFTTHNFQDANKKSYWGMPPDQDTAPSGAWANCTNYVAFVESEIYGVPTPKEALPINALDWATGARENGFTVDQTPTVGSVAQWDPDLPVIGTDGHVAVVEAVGANDSYIVVSQDNWHSDTDYYGWAVISADASGQGEPWPDNFIHFPGPGLPTTLSYTQPDRLVQSTENLYWTADRTAYRFQGRHVVTLSEADVFRSAKDNEPGQEKVLYQESVPAGSVEHSVDFEAITYANVGGSWYGYFVANYPLHEESQIKRVPLTGGAADVLATSPGFIGNRDLVTDGLFLYWADATGIRKMSVGGGTVETLVAGTTFSHLGLDGALLYYSSGDNILDVATNGNGLTAVASAANASSPIFRRPPVNGVGSTVIVSGASAITALYPPSAANLNVYWAEADGSVSLFPGPFGSAYQLQAPRAGESVTSLALAGNFIVWAGCMSISDGVATCQVDGYDNGNLVTVPTSAAAVDVQGDADAWYWGDYDLEKFTL
ncbi:MAG: CHAP domain-containing protein [Acidimicrobiales bacterium]|jgi:surface antigen